MSRVSATRPAVVASLVAIALLGAIAGRSFAQSDTPAAPPAVADVTVGFAGVPWRISEVAGKRAPPDARITFSAKTISGAAGCNRFFAPLVSGSAPRVGTIQSTRMLCKGRMESERAVFDALRRMHTASRTGDTLELRDDTGSAVLKLVR
jgi:heat shock protein HslJ